jgi:hypothetical protein
VAQSETLYGHLPGDTEEIHQNLSQDSRSPYRDLNPGPPEALRCTVLLCHFSRSEDYIYLKLVSLLNITAESEKKNLYILHTFSHIRLTVTTGNETVAFGALVRVPLTS